MATTPGSAEHDARLRDVVSAAVPATAEAVLTDPAWPALRAGLRHIENHGGDPRAELAAAAASQPLRGADSAARVLRRRLATRSAEQDHGNGTAAVPADTRDRDAGSVLRALAEDPVGTAAAYADAEVHRDTNPAAAQAWDEVLRAENIDPQRVRDDAAAHRDTASTDRPATARDLDTVGDASRDGFAEDYLSALVRDGVDPDTARTQLRAGDTTAERPTAEQSPAPRTMFSHGADAARLAGLSHPRSVAEQLATRKPGGQETPPLADAKTTRSGTATAHGERGTQTRAQGSAPRRVGVGVAVVQNPDQPTVASVAVPTVLRTCPRVVHARRPPACPRRCASGSGPTRTRGHQGEHPEEHFANRVPRVVNAPTDAQLRAGPAAGVRRRAPGSGRRCRCRPASRDQRDLGRGGRTRGVCARRAGQAVVTSDPGDLRHLDPGLMLVEL